MNDFDKLSEHVVKTNNAIGFLFENNYDEAAVMLIFTWIDRMAWLSVETDESTGGDFKAWLNKYFFTDGDGFLCDAGDLWGSRCSLLHTGTAEGRDVKKGRARKVYFYGGDMAMTSENDDEVLVHTRNLHQGLINATGRFMNHLESNQQDLDIVNKKLGSILARRAQ